MSRDLYDHESPIRRIDGTVPFNGHLWPTESWWPDHDKSMPQGKFFRFHFGIVALEDGRFSVDGDVDSIIHNDTEGILRRYDDPRRVPVVFESRIVAIRTAAARMLKSAAAFRKLEGAGALSGRMTNELLSILYNWTMEKVAAATASEPPRQINLTTPTPPPPVPPAPEDGLELWEAAKAK
jgi:hypothetical protein